MPRAPGPQRPPNNERERTTKLRPGRLRPINTSPRRITGTAKNLFRLVRLVSRSSPSTKEGSKSRAGASTTRRASSPFQRRAIVNVRYTNAKTPGGWKAHGIYVERESAKGDERTKEQQRGKENEPLPPNPDRLGLAQEQTLASLADTWQKAGDQRIFTIII
jgi:hypothetical protein